VLLAQTLLIIRGATEPVNEPAGAQMSIRGGEQS